MENINDNTTKTLNTEKQDSYFEKICKLDEVIKNIEETTGKNKEKRASELELNLEMLIHELRNNNIIDDSFVFVLRLMPVSLRAKKLRNYLSRLASKSLFRQNIDDACFYNSKSLIAADIQCNYKKAKKSGKYYKDECVDILRKEKIKLMRKANK